MEEQIKQKNPTFQRYLFTVTLFSKILAMFLFILFPFVGFYLGMKYQEIQEIITVNKPSIAVITITPTPTPNITALPTLTASETANWKTYTNGKLTFKYPSDWTITNKDTYYSYNIVKMTFNEGGKDYEFTVKSAGGGDIRAGEIIDSNPLIIIQGKKFLKRTWVTDGKPFFVAFATNQSGFDIFNSILMQIPNTNTDKYVKIFDQIISTINFAT